MEKPFLVEIRIADDLKELSKKLIYDIYHKFHVRGAVKHKPVPHITLFGPFRCRSVNDVVNAIGEVGSGYSELKYQVDGFDSFELKKKFLFITTSVKKNVIYLKIIPSQELQEFRYNLAKKLLKITDSVNVDNDSKGKFQFHSTIAMKDIDKKFETIWEYLQNYEIKSNEICTRVTLLREGKILYEYDLQSKRLLNRRQVLGERPSRHDHTRQDRTRQDQRRDNRQNSNRYTRQAHKQGTRQNYRRDTRQDRTRQERHKPYERSTATLHECYTILEVNEKSTQEDIHRSYKRLSLMWHPDKHIDSTRKKIAEEQMKLINNAKQVLEKAGKM